MESIDKNDVDIRPLFRWGKEVEINDASGNPVKLYVRIVGDAELNRARVYGLRTSKELRKKLRDKESDERLIYIPDWNDLEINQVCDIYLSLVAREIVQAVIKDLDMNLPAEPKSGASLEEEEEYQTKLDNWSEDRRRLIEAGVAIEMEKRRAKLSGMPKEELDKLTERTAINELCEDAMYKAFIDWVLSKAVYTDPEYKNLLFKDVEDFKDLMPDANEALASAYEEINLGMETLKKSQGVTQ